MTTALATQNGHSVDKLGEMSVQAIVDRKRKLVEVMQSVMTDGVHYGKIPGCGDKPTLYKSGAEVLATVFGLAPTFVIQETQIGNGHREYRVTCTLTHIGSGKSLGEGVGVGSTMESKYRWRQGRRECPKCHSTAALFRSKNPGEGFYCWTKKDGCGAKFAPGDPAIEGQSVDRVENPDVADTYNTVLKMAKKRAQVDATLTAVGASDILTQDLEDLPAGTRTDQESDFPRGTDGAQDAEFRDVPAGHDQRDPLRDIDNAQSIGALEALIPDLGKLKGDIHKRARARYGERRAELLKRQQGAA